MRLEPKQLTHVVTTDQAHSGDWISATPITQIGTKLNDDELRISIAFCLWLVLCHPHRCRCGSSVFPDDLRPLSCWLSASRFPRHAEINDIAKRALVAARFHFVLKRVGLDDGNGRRPDGITVFPFGQSKALVWDATCTDTFAPSKLLASASNPGSACIAAEVRKRLKYTQDRMSRQTL